MKIKTRFSLWEPYSNEISKPNEVYSLSDILLKTIAVTKRHRKTIQDPPCTEK